MSEEIKTKSKSTKKNKEPFFKRLIKNPLLISIFAAIVILLLGFVYVTNWLEDYTNHGKEIEAPDLSGMTEKESADLLALKGLTYEVIDSTYVKGMKPGAIVDQVPKAGAKVKEGRKVYVKIQAYSAKKVSLPEVREGSARQAENLLASVGLKVSNLEYVPSEQSGNVIEVKYHDQIVLPNTQLVEGSAVTLVIGRGLSNVEVVVSSFRNLTIERARNEAHEKDLNIGAITFDKGMSDEDKEKAVVYKQSPITGKVVPAGTRIDLYMTSDKNKLEEPEEVFKDETVTDSVASSDDGLWN
ncbi:MAG: PASTA domain-containing protein [Paludibacteraceae bacterium]|nr:PASTA domain-containing protein [Paludibacteraceae bacterium]